MHALHALHEFGRITVFPVQRNFGLQICKFSLARPFVTSLFPYFNTKFPLQLHN